MEAVMNDATNVQASKFCFACGNGIDHRAEICPKCGVRQTAATARKSRMAAVLLALFLGGLGIHKFYLGRPGWGILYILFCWTFIPSIIAFIEAIVYLCTSDEQFAAKYG
jgi:TM2 domain-containing membrane protein YozV